ncbi:MAG: DNRLRE domain-containing protein, partial [Verrucomicrobiae bacterium]
MTKRTAIQPWPQRKQTCSHRTTQFRAWQRAAAWAGPAFLFLVLTALIASTPSTNAGTVTLLTSTFANNPTILGFEFDAFQPGSNTKDWWRYSGASGVRIFIPGNVMDPLDNTSPSWGDGVTNQSSFLSRKAALRADPLNTNYINWPLINSRTTGNFMSGEYRKLNVQILLCQKVQDCLPALNFTNNDWKGIWELWHLYYENAFYYARNFDVQRFSMDNEPDLSGYPLSQADWLRDMKICADAIQSAVADVNARYGKSLVPMLFSPVTAGVTANGWNSWGQACVNARHTNYLGAYDTNFWLMQKYDYHEYNGTPSTFGSQLSTLNSTLTSAMPGETRFPTAITEFNVYNGGAYDTKSTSLDDPSDYSRFGSICVQLVKNKVDEMYCFAFGQNSNPGGNWPVYKNSMHYYDLTSNSHNYGGSNKGGEVYRLFAKGFSTGGSQLDYTSTVGSSLDLRSGYDPATRRYYLFSCNNSSSSVTYTVDTTALNLPVGNPVLIEEVSESCYGGGRYWGSIASDKTVSNGSSTSLVQPGYATWLFSFPVNQRAVQTINASDDVTVTDGTNATVNFGGADHLSVHNDPTDASQRSAALIKFPLAGINPSEIQMAVLQVTDWTASGSLAQAHVYGLDNDAWSEASVTWSTAPNLAQGKAAGNMVADRVILGQGNTTHILGQLVANSTTHATDYIDVTAWLRSKAPGSASASFLLSQDPRWDVTLPSLAAGDTQADGITLGANEGGSGPQLLIITSGLRWNAGSGNWDTSTANWVDSASPAGGLTYAQGNAVTFDDNAPGSGPITVTLTASRAPLNVCVSNQAKAYTLTGSAITGKGGLVKSGVGTLTLSCPNSYTGDTVVGQGTLAITTGGKISPLSGITVASGATLTTSVSNTFGGVPAGAWTIAGTIGGSASVQSLPSSVTLNNGTMTGNTFASYGTFLANASATQITANGDSNTISSGNFGLAGSMTFSTPLATDALNVSAVLGATSANGGSVTKTGEGAVTLSGNNTYSGGTTIKDNGGTLLI